MGTEAEQDLDQVTSKENEFDELEGEEQQPEGEESEESAEGGEEQGDEETQPQKTFTQQELDEIVQKRITRLKKGKEPADDQTKSDLELERERNRLLQMALEQAKGGSQKADEKPNPDNFDGGEYDPEYIKQAEDYRLKQVQAEAKRIYQEERDQDARRQAQESEARELEKAQVAHYQRALTLEVKDYDKHEDRVIEALGLDAFNVIIRDTGDSAEVTNFLGTPANESKLKEIQSYVKSGTPSGTAKALVELGRISASLAVNSKSKPAPNPVDNLEGATPTASAVEAKINAAWKQYEKGAISMQEYINRKKAIVGKS